MPPTNDLVTTPKHGPEVNRAYEKKARNADPFPLAIIMHEYDEDEHVKEVIARFGLALYFAQVLEHGLVNALAIVDLLPSRHHFARSSDEWGVEVDAFMDRNFEKTMGRMIKSLLKVTPVDADLEQLLYIALRKRNWLVHTFFREYADQFPSTTGREQMISELDKCRDLFRSVDHRLETTVAPLRERFGITDELLAQEYERMLTELRDDG